MKRFVRWFRWLRKRCTRMTRYRAALMRQNARIDAMPKNRFDMSKTEHEQFVTATERIIRHMLRLQRVSRRWRLQR